VRFLNCAEALSFCDLLYLMITPRALQVFDPIKGTRQERG